MSIRKQDADVKMSSPVLNNDCWNPALPIEVQLRDHDGDIKMQPSELELSRDTANVVDSVFRLDINIDKLFGNIGPTTQLQHQHLNTPTTNVQHAAPRAPAFPPGLNSWRSPGSDDVHNSSYVPQARELNTHIASDVVPVPFTSPAVDVEMSDVLSPPLVNTFVASVSKSVSRRKKFNAPRPYLKSRGSQVRFVAVLDTGPILPATCNVSEPAPVVYVERAVEVSSFATIISTSKLT